MPHRNSEETIRAIRDTRESDIPSKENGEKTEHSTCLDEFGVGDTTCGCDVVTDTEHEEGDPEPEEEETKDDCGSKGEKPEE
jgi:hypothetical protein